MDYDSIKFNPVTNSMSCKYMKVKQILKKKKKPKKKERKKKRF